MKVYMFSIYDHEKCRTVSTLIDREPDGKRYQECMDDFNDLNDIRRYHYFMEEYAIDFQWDISPEWYHECMFGKSYGHVGNLYFGRYRLELMKGSIDSTKFFSLKKLGEEGFGHLENGIAYNEIRDFGRDIKMPCRRTFKSFAKSVEDQIIDILNSYNATFIMDACERTNPDAWYPLDQKVVFITRKA